MVTPTDTNAALRWAVHHHPRNWQDFRYVYPVISRRSGGLSIGINLNPDHTCNFDCVYCSVDRSVARQPGPIVPGLIEAELVRLLDAVDSGDLWREPMFRDLPRSMKHLRDIAFSGDGEPTLCRSFGRVVELVANIKTQRRLDGVKMVLFTNASALDQPAVRDALKVMDGHEGEVWAKLDAGSESYYRAINRSKVPLDRIVHNILECGRDRPIVIQTLLVRLGGASMSEADFDAYVDRLVELVQAGCRIRLVQLYTVARQTRESFVTPVSNAVLSTRAVCLAMRLPQLTVETYGAG